MRNLRVKPEGVETRADLENFMKDYNKESHTVNVSYHVCLYFLERKAKARLCTKLRNIVTK